ncbi:MAG: hypothetical protein AMJ42_00390 [Deltaproteobacteria bacterium DG_8]|nr:MAG: hypothetical protein AMJ42_00390 [Deltaproteobacteria bacterium DG_8]
MIDTHAHMNEIGKIEQTIQRAKGVGVNRIVAVGMDIDSNRATLSLARQFPEIIYPAIGYHPWSITLEGIEDNLTFIEKNLSSCIALGEVGLDYKTRMKKNIQWEVFFRILLIVKNSGRPVIVHSRFSHKRTHQMVREAGVEKAVFHWYSGPLDILDNIIEDGYFISATPALAYSLPHQTAIKRAPLERILIETDAPVEYQGKVSEPADLVITLREVSRLKGLEPDEVKRITTANAKKFFTI